MGDVSGNIKRSVDVFDGPELIELFAS